MKLVISSLLALAVIGLFQCTSASVSEISLDLIQTLKPTNDNPEPPVQVEDEVFALFDNTINEDDIEVPENPPEDISTSDCIINIRSGLVNPQPLFLVTDEEKFYPFSETGNMEVPAGKTMQMFCPSNFKSFAAKLITATCEKGKNFSVDGQTYQFSDFVCKSWPAFIVRKMGSDCNGGTMLEVGFQVSSTRFLQEMEICFNEEEEVTRYVYHTLHPGSNFFQTKVERLNFQTGGFFGGKNVDKLYTQKMQMQTIDNDLGGESDKYFDSSQNVFLSRGHLSAKADMMYGSQQRGTFLFVNAAPQWHVFNAGNWARIEDGVRAWVSKNKMHVECYTGVYGVTTLPHKEGHDTPLYLARDANNNGLIPVPKLYFRVVIEPATEKGIVFVGVNNPHLTLEQIQKDYIICKDISNKVNYINWKKRDLIAGYSYACQVSDFVKEVKNLPPLTANGGLLI